MASIDEIIKGEVPEVETPEEPVEVAQEAVSAEETEQATPEVEATDDAEPEGKFEKKAVQNPDDDPEIWTKAAYLDEKGKRQRLQGELDQQSKSFGDMQAQLAQYQQQQPQQFIDPLDDAQGFANQQHQTMQQQFLTQTINTSRMFAVKEHGKEAVKAAEATFNTACATDAAASALSRQFANSQDPIGDVMAWNKSQELINAVGNDPDAYKAKIREELLAEMNAQDEETQPSTTNPRTMPSNFASANSKGKRRGPGWSGPKSIGDILA